MLHLICLAKLLKALVRLLITRVLVRVKLPGQHIVCPLHLLWRSILQSAGNEQQVQQPCQTADAQQITVSGEKACKNAGDVSGQQRAMRVRVLLDSDNLLGTNPVSREPSALSTGSMLN